MATEPMTLGSPRSPASPVSPVTHVQGQYLPSYLLGDAPPVLSPSTSKLWAHTAPGSGPRGGLNQSQNLGTSPWASPQTTASGSMLAQQSRHRDLVTPRTKDKVGAPPVTGLLETIKSPAFVPDRKADFGGQSFNSPYIQGTPTATLHTPGTPSMYHSFNDANHMLSHTRKTPPSPAQIDPFYTQGESIRPGDELDETWVTVFGFPPGASSFVLQQFSQYGNLIKYVVSTDGNWMHLHYQSKLQAKKALSKNGKVFGSSIMVGVSPCIDKDVMEVDKENSDSVIRTSYLGTPTQRLDQSRTDSSTRPAAIRPLTAAYRAAKSDHEVAQKNNTPQKNNNMVSKAMEYVFGW